MRLIEMFTCSKTGNEKLNEDVVYFDGNFAAVIDGATSKSGVVINGITEGKFASQTVSQLLKKVDAHLSPQEIVIHLSNGLREASLDMGFPQKPSAVITVYNDIRKELFTYGDCPYKINGKVYPNIKVNDIEIARQRATIIKNALDNGLSIADIQEDDIGRKIIVQKLIDEAETKANLRGDGGYPVLNGDEPIEKYITVHSIHSASEIIITSDGYPEIFPTLKQTEENLFALLKKDPLCINELCGTKGVMAGNISYDDRSYMRFMVE